MTWRWRLRPVLGALAVVLACAAAGRADGALVPNRVLGDHLVSDVASVHVAHLSSSDALPARARTAAVRHLVKHWRLPAVVPTSAALAAIALAALLASVVRGRRLTETPTRLPPRAPPAAGTSVPGHGGGRRGVLGPLGSGAVALA
jgi:hypothetical protein